MQLMFNSFWRALSYCLFPRVIGLSFVPLALMVVTAFGLGYVYWESSVAGVAAWLQSTELTQSALNWLDSVGWASLRSVIAPMAVLFMATPIIVVLSLLLVALFMTPAMVSLVAKRRFVHLQRFHGGSLIASVLWSLGSTLLAVLALLVSIPLWFIPPLVLVVPPLIWGWLTYRVFTFDALAEHATKAERELIFERHRLPLLAIGVISGYMGAAPSLLWASGAMFIALAPLLVPLAIWVYTLVFALSSLWFAHYVLSALEALRRESGQGSASPYTQADGGPAPFDDVVDAQDVMELSGPRANQLNS
ncbi:EI24 domain-containing protein [Comamonadaceae bacterium M7527]|nr:EI24 domain-containing protein [Comamonadaceae bacterium M7527]